MFPKIKRKKTTQQNSTNNKNTNIDASNGLINRDIAITIDNLKKAVNFTNDLVVRDFNLEHRGSTKAAICYISGITNETTLLECMKDLLNFSMQDKKFTKNKTLLDSESDKFIDFLKDDVISVPNVQKVGNHNDIVLELLRGKTLIFVNGFDSAIIVDTIGHEKRSIEKPDTESTIRGSQESFTESIKTNISLIRKRITHPSLVIESFTIGSQTNTIVKIAYIKGVVLEEPLKIIREKLQKINIDILFETGYIENYIQEKNLSLFITIGNSEKPDKVCAKIFDGRIAIFCEGTPTVLTVPYLFAESFQITEDYYSRPFFSSLVRIMRYLCFLISLTIPALYITLTSYHQEMIPDILLVTTTASREGIPFPAFLETLIMLLIFEILKESGIRLPKKVGQAVSIVGALIIGQAAVEAGIISSPMVIIGALTGIASFMIPPLVDGMAIYRLVLVALSTVLGLYGFSIGMVLLLAHLCSLKSFGDNYFAPYGPTILYEVMDGPIVSQKPYKLKKKKSLSPN
ncbi:spore germination protein [Oscillospiraceae bacterium PP1C4]